MSKELVAPRASWRRFVTRSALESLINPRMALPCSGCVFPLTRFDRISACFLSGRALSATSQMSNGRRATVGCCACTMESMNTMTTSPHAASSFFLIAARLSTRCCRRRASVCASSAGFTSERPQFHWDD